MTTPDPNKLLIIHRDPNSPIDWTWRADAVAMRTFPNATMHRLSSCRDDQDGYRCMMGAIRQQVREHGTLKELIVEGHGDSELMGRVEIFNLPTFFDDIGKMQTELGTKIADRFVFPGCNVFSNLKHPSRVEFYRDTAQKLDAEIAGMTRYGYTGVIMDKSVGRYVQFTPDGEVKRDPVLDDPVGTWLASLGGIRKTREDKHLGIKHDDSWLRCHMGKTQEEGAQCQLDWQKTLTKVDAAPEAPPALPAPASMAPDAQRKR